MGQQLELNGQRHPVWLDDAGILHVGAATIAVDHVDPAAAEYEWKTQAELSVDTFAAGQPAVVLATPVGSGEDPPNRYQVFLVDDKGLERVFDQVIGSYGVHPVRLPGDGTIRYQEDGWTACERLQFPTQANMQEVVFRLDPHSGQAIEAERNDTADVMICDQLSG